METVLIVVTVLSVAAAAGFAAAAWRARAEEQRRSAARVAALASTLSADDAPLEPDAARPVAVASLFAAAAGTLAGSRSFITRAAITAVATAIVIVGITAGGGADRATAPPQPAPLELISMRHVRDGRTLTVTGLVRNPHRGTPLTQAAALVFAFDREGSFVASGRAALDVATLGPGDQSPFVVTLTDLAEVGRYRVSFRTENGLVRHIDRRGDASLVRGQ